MCVTEVTSEDPRYRERDPPPIAEEFPEGSKVFFLGEHAYGVAAQVSGTTEDTLAVILAVSTLAYNTTPNIVSDLFLLSFPFFFSPRLVSAVLPNRTFGSGEVQGHCG
jgi:hypothetical protein